MNDANGVRLGRLVPIPTVWAAMFLDYPNIGTALRRTRALIGSVPLDKVKNFKLLAYSTTYATFLIPNSPDMSSVLQLDWKRLPRGKSNMTWRIQAWQAGDHAPSETEFDEGESIDKESDKSEPDPFMATYGGVKRQRIVFPKALAFPTVSWGGSPYGARVHQEPRQYPSRPATTTGRATSAKPPTPRPSQPAGGGGIKAWTSVLSWLLCCRRRRRINWQLRQPAIIIWWCSILQQHRPVQQAAGRTPDF